MSRPSQPPAQVVSLSEFRVRHRLSAYQGKIAGVLDANKRAIGRLYQTDALFSREGTRAGRDLLLAHQHLLRVAALLDRLANQGDVPAPRKPDEVDAVYQELDSLLDRTNELTSRTGQFLARLKRD